MDVRNAQAFQAILQGNADRMEVDDALMAQFQQFRDEAMRAIAQLHQQNQALHLENVQLHVTLGNERGMAEIASNTFKNEVRDLQEKNKTLHETVKQKEEEITSLLDRPKCLVKKHEYMDQMNEKRVKKHGTKNSKAMRKKWNKDNPNDILRIR